MRPNIREILYDGFIRPFHHPGLLALYIGVIVGLFGIIMVTIFLSFDLSGFGMAELMAFLVSHLAVINLVLMPAALLLLHRFTALKFFLVLIAAQLLIFAFFHDKDLSALMIGIVYAFISAPFWLLYHLSVMHYSSDANRGNEISIAHICMTTGTIAGSITAGYLLSQNTGREAILVTGFILAIASTVFLTFFAARRGVFAVHDRHRAALGGRGVVKSLLDYPARTRATMAEMLHDTATSTLWPVWMKLIGAGGLAVGFLYAATVAMHFLLSPVVGRFVNLRSGFDSQYGPVIKLAGWLPWLVIVHPLTSLWSSVFFSAGSHFFKIGLEARWYEAKTYSHLAAREICIGIGRIGGLCLLMPVLFYATEYYVYAGILATMAVLLSGIHLRRTLAVQPVK